MKGYLITSPIWVDFAKSGIPLNIIKLSQNPAICHWSEQVCISDELDRITFNKNAPFFATGQSVYIRHMERQVFAFKDDVTHYTPSGVAVNPWDDYPSNRRLAGKLFIIDYL